MLAVICGAITIVLINLQLTKVKATDDQCSEYQFKPLSSLEILVRAFMI